MGCVCLSLSSASLCLFFSFSSFYSHKIWCKVFHFPSLFPVRFYTFSWCTLRCIHAKSRLFIFAFPFFSLHSQLIRGEFESFNMTLKSSLFCEKNKFAMILSKNLFKIATKSLKFYIFYWFVKIGQPYLKFKQPWPVFTIIFKKY